MKIPKAERADMPGEKEEFMDYLNQRLIPDLQESGYEATARDFTVCLAFMEWDKGGFISYLVNVLIPDLRESGHHETAKDFAKAVHFLMEE